MRQPNESNKPFVFSDKLIKKNPLLEGAEHCHLFQFFRTRKTSKEEDAAIIVWPRKKARDCAYMPNVLQRLFLHSNGIHSRAVLDLWTSGVSGQDVLRASFLEASTFKSTDLPLLYVASFFLFLLFGFGFMEKLDFPLLIFSLAISLMCSYSLHRYMRSSVEGLGHAKGLLSHWYLCLGMNTPSFKTESPTAGDFIKFVTALIIGISIFKLFGQLELFEPPPQNYQFPRRPPKAIGPQVLQFIWSFTSAVAILSLMLFRTSQEKAIKTYELIMAEADQVFDDFVRSHVIGDPDHVPGNRKDNYRKA